MKLNSWKKLKLYQIIMRANPQCTEHAHKLGTELIEDKIDRMKLDSWIEVASSHYALKNRIVKSSLNDASFFLIDASAYQPNRFHTAVKIRRSDFGYKVYKCHKSVAYCILIKTIEDYSFGAFVNRTNISIATVAVPIWKLDFNSLKVWKIRFVIGQTVIIMIINGATVDMIIICDLGWRTWTAYLHSGCAQRQGLSL